MQLSRILNYHKALSDATRVRILALLADGPLHGQALAGKLGLSPPTITHHMTKLREASLVSERKEKNTVYFYLNRETLMQDAMATVDTILGKQNGDINLRGDRTVTDGERAKVIQNFFTPDGRLKNIPAQRKKKLIVFEWMLRGLQMGKKYSEQEINQHILQYHDDYATIRREFIINHFMYRENGMYEMNPPQLWAKS
jgi:hypothetical protein